jgi:DNA-binding NtrC family response regulator
MEFLKDVIKNHPDIITIMITSTNSVSQAVNAVHLGAYHYIVKPFELDELEIIIKNALDKVNLTKKVKDLESGASLNKPVFIGQSPKIQKIKDQIEILTKQPFSCILLTGETGTGKGNLAKYLHWKCNNDMSGFMHISCADLPPDLLETELFGYVKGAFTDAKDDKPGLLELAEGGTLFLDEIDASTPKVQAKLLYFLDNKSFRRVGGTKEISANVRLIVATNANLPELVKKQSFRKDLFYRLNVINITLPPLREKRSDIKHLANHFKNLFNITFSKNIDKISPEATVKLEEYNWPGNIRELKNVLERSMIFCHDNTLKPRDIELDEKINLINKGQFSYPEKEEELLPLREQEVNYIKHALKVMKNHKSNTAKKLKITLATLLSKLKQ